MQNVSRRVFSRRINVGNADLRETVEIAGQMYNKLERLDIGSKLTIMFNDPRLKSIFNVKKGLLESSKRLSRDIARILPEGRYKIYSLPFKEGQKLFLVISDGFAKPTFNNELVNMLSSLLNEGRHAKNGPAYNLITCGTKRVGPAQNLEELDKVPTMPWRMDGWWWRS